MLHELLECLGDIDGLREPAKVEHRLADVLAIAACAVLAHAEGFENIALYGRSKRTWLSRFLELPNGIRSHDTFRRVLMLINSGEFERSFLADAMGVRHGRRRLGRGPSGRTVGNDHDIS